jgi:hypothetical protein
MRRTLEEVSFASQQIVEPLLTRLFWAAKSTANSGENIADRLDAVDHI